MGLPIGHGGLPAHDEVGTGQVAFEAVCIAGAVALIVIHIGRLILVDLSWSWSLLIAIVCGAICADFTSGILHWFADTWFAETMPFLGRRLLRPFRVHHVNPDDFLRRNFVDTNGDVAMLCDLVMLAMLVIPLNSQAGLWWDVMLLTFCFAGLPTNQIHQWAHSRRPPPLVGWLQRRGIILSGTDHQRHHVPPYDDFYCIAIGWLNRPLSAIQFFRRLEGLITRLTGLRPREDDTRFVDDVTKRVTNA
jgi:plasmanylethanolamine desaturase